MSIQYNNISRKIMSAFVVDPVKKYLSNWIGWLSIAEFVAYLLFVEVAYDMKIRIGVILFVALLLAGGLMLTIRTEIKLFPHKSDSYQLCRMLFILQSEGIDSKEKVDELIKECGVVKTEKGSLVREVFNGIKVVINGLLVIVVSGIVFPLLIKWLSRHNVSDRDYRKFLILFEKYIPLVFVVCLLVTMLIVLYNYFAFYRVKLMYRWVKSARYLL